MITGSEALWLSLIEEGVDTVFGYPGGQIMPVCDSVCGYKDRVRHILVRHEQGAIHAAQGYARVKGDPGVVIVTSGPGATNTVTGIATAYMDSVPIVVITGQVATKYIGQDAFQENHLRVVPAVAYAPVIVGGVDRVVDLGRKAKIISRVEHGSPLKGSKGLGDKK